VTPAVRGGSGQEIQWRANALARTSREPGAGEEKDPHLSQCSPFAEIVRGPRPNLSRCRKRAGPNERRKTRGPQRFGPRAAAAQIKNKPEGGSQAERAGRRTPALTPGAAARDREGQGMTQRSAATREEKAGEREEKPGYARYVARHGSAERGQKRGSQKAVCRVGMATVCCGA